jgi:[ribosomal protein S5]-alanine N-acetyltransferase
MHRWHPRQLSFIYPSTLMLPLPKPLAPVAMLITLEPRKMIHAQELFEVLVDPKLYEFIDEDPPASVEALRQKLSRSENRKSPDGTEHWLNWVVRDSAGAMAGYVQTTIAANGQANVAYSIGTQFWGKGIASNAVSQMIQMVAEQFFVTEFYILAERKNVKSVQLANRLGFVEVGPHAAKIRSILATDILLQKNL